MQMPLLGDSPGRGIPFGAEPRDSSWTGRVGAAPETTWLYVEGRPCWRASASLPKLRAGTVSGALAGLPVSASFRCRRGRGTRETIPRDNRSQVDQKNRSSLAHI